MRNYNVDVRESGDRILFLHRLKPGGADRSYGIEVGRLAGLPQPVIARARALLKLLEGEQIVAALSGKAGIAARAPRGTATNSVLFASELPHPVVERLREIDVNTLTPLEALALLAQLAAEARVEPGARAKRPSPRCGAGIDFANARRRTRPPGLRFRPRDDGLDAADPADARHARIRTPVWAKAETYNPGGSVKDRIGMPIIEKAERDGSLKPGGTIVEGTSGNTGVALAIAAALKGYKCIFTMPDKMSQEKVRLLKAYGAEVVITPTAVPPDHPDSYVMTAKRIAHETPNAILANQFYNQANPDAHYATTGPELWEQTRGAHHASRCRRGNGRHDHRRGALSQGKESEDSDHLRRSQSARFSPNIGAAMARIKPRACRTRSRGSGRTRFRTHSTCSLIDEFQTVSDRDAFAMARRLTREEGLFAGGSSGLLAHVALTVARRVNDPNACIVTFLCDTGERYLSKLYNDEWMRENQLLDAEKVTLGHLLDVKGRAVASRRHQHRAGRDRAAGIAADGLARCVAAARDGRPQLRRVGERKRAERARPRGRESARADRGRHNGLAVPRRRCRAPDGCDRQAPLEIESRRARAREGRDTRNRHAIRHAALLDGALR